MSGPIMSLDTSAYWDKRDLLSKNRFISVAVGGRGIGKTYSMKCFALEKYNKTNVSTIWVRRYAEDIKPSNGLSDRFLSDLPEKYRNQFFVSSNAVYDIRDATEASIEKDCLFPREGAVPAITFIALSTARRLKSQSWANYSYIVFDEFLEPRGGRYLPDEYSKFLDLLETICRTRTDIRVIMIANATSANNPYFAEWGIGTSVKIPEEGVGFRKISKDIVVEWVRSSEEFYEYKKNTPLGRLAEGTSWFKSSIDNLSPDDEMYGICKKPAYAEYNYSIVLSGNKYGVWYYNGRLFINQQYDPMFPDVVSDNTIDNKNCSNFSYYKKTFVDGYIGGTIWFDSMSTKYDILQRCGLKV